MSTVLKIIVALAVAAEAVSPTVSLGYSTYHGATLNNGVSQWLGMRYAAPPLGPLRFAAPADPVNTSEVQGANKVVFSWSLHLHDILTRLRRSTALSAWPRMHIQ